MTESGFILALMFLPSLYIVALFVQSVKGSIYNRRYTRIRLGIIVTIIIIYAVIAIAYDVVIAEAMKATEARILLSIWIILLKKIGNADFYSIER